MFDTFMAIGKVVNAFGANSFLSIHFMITCFILSRTARHYIKKVLALEVAKEVMELRLDIAKNNVDERDEELALCYNEIHHLRQQMDLPPHERKGKYKPIKRINRMADGERKIDL